MNVKYRANLRYYYSVIILTGLGLLISMSYNACGKGFDSSHGITSNTLASSIPACPTEKPQGLSAKASSSSPFSSIRKLIVDESSLSPSASGQQKLQNTQITLNMHAGKELVALIDNNCAKTQNLNTSLSYDFSNGHWTDKSGLEAYLLTLAKDVSIDVFHQRAIDDPCIIGISENRQYKSQSFNDSNHYLQTHFTPLEAFEAHNNFQTNQFSISQDVVVAVIDTGVDYNHPDLINQMWKHSGGIGFNIPEEGNAGEFNPMDNSPVSHGTHVAGIIAAEANNGTGVAGLSPFNTKIMAINVFKPDGTSNTQLVVKGMMTALANGADVANLSLGKYVTDGSEDLLYLTATKELTSKGVFVVAVAGNSSVQYPQSKITADAFSVLPARYGKEVDGMLTVGSVDVNSKSLSSFSHFGSDFVEIAAYGNTSGSGSFGIYSTLSFTLTGALYGRLAGTSMAGPMVSSAAVFVNLYFRNKGLSVTPALIEKLILSSSTKSDSLKTQIKNGNILNFNSLAETLTTCY